MQAEVSKPMTATLGWNERVALGCKVGMGSGTFIANEFWDDGIKRLEIRQLLMCEFEWLSDNFYFC